MSWNSSTMIDRKRSCSASRTRASRDEQIAREQLEVLEVERRLALLAGPVLGREEVEQLLEERLVARRDQLERCLLDLLRASSKAAARGPRVRSAARSISVSGSDGRSSAARAAARWFSVAPGSSSRPCAARAGHRGGRRGRRGSSSSSVSSRPAERSVS